MKSIEELQAEKLQMEVDKLRAEINRLNQAKTTDNTEENKLMVEKLRIETEKIKIDIEQTKTETENLQRLKRVDSKRFWLGVIGPTISAIALIGTLLFQINTNSDDRELKRQADEDTQWRSFLAKVNDTTITIPDAILNRSFFRSPKYRNEALEIAANIYLPNATDIKYFELVFNDFSYAIDLSTYRYLVDLTYQLERKVKVTPVGLEVYYHDISPVIEDQLSIASNRLVKFIREQQGAHELNLNYAVFLNINMDSTKFGESSLKSTRFWNTSLYMADLSGIRSFSNSSWGGTAWWRAHKISNELLDYLITTFPYYQEITYYKPNAKLYDKATKDKDRSDYNNYIEQNKRYKELKKKMDSL